MKPSEMSVVEVFKHYQHKYLETLAGEYRKPNSRVNITCADVSDMLNDIQSVCLRAIDASAKSTVDSRVNIVADRGNWRKQALSEAQRYDVLIEAVRRMLKAGDAERKAHEQQMLAFTERKAAENAVVNIALAALEERKIRNGGEE